MSFRDDLGEAVGATIADVQAVATKLSLQDDMWLALEIVRTAQERMALQATLRPGIAQARPPARGWKAQRNMSMYEETRPPPTPKVTATR